MSRIGDGCLDWTSRATPSAPRPGAGIERPALSLRSGQFPQPNAKANVNSRRRRGEGENAANRATKLKGRLSRHNNVYTNTLRLHELWITGLAAGRLVK